MEINENKIIESVFRESFYHDGRGPELQKVHYSNRGQTIKAVDYFNPDDGQTPENLKHLIFIRPQAFMFTPEEVYNYQTTQIDWGKYNGAAIVSLGKSDWLNSFSPRHLASCNHYQVMFYDEFLDIICEGMETKLGGYEVRT